MTISQGGYKIVIGYNNSTAYSKSTTGCRIVVAYHNFVFIHVTNVVTFARYVVFFLLCIYHKVGHRFTVKTGPYVHFDLTTADSNDSISL